MLELSKMVYTEQLEGSQKASLALELKASVEKKLCKTFLTLGEVSLENENYAQAAEEAVASLEAAITILDQNQEPLGEF
jgi:hypothetical protein